MLTGYVGANSGKRFLAPRHQRKPGMDLPTSKHVSNGRGSSKNRPPESAPGFRGQRTYTHAAVSHRRTDGAAWPRCGAIPRGRVDPVRGPVRDPTVKVQPANPLRPPPQRVSRKKATLLHSVSAANRFTFVGTRRWRVAGRSARTRCPRTSGFLL